MAKLNMTPKQTYGALYAIDRYLDQQDHKALYEIVSIGDSDYSHGYRDGMVRIIDGITKIINKYQKEE